MQETKKGSNLAVATPVPNETCCKRGLKSDVINRFVVQVRMRNVTARRNHQNSPLSMITFRLICHLSILVSFSTD